MSEAAFIHQAAAIEQALQELASAQRALVRGLNDVSLDLVEERAKKQIAQTRFKAIEGEIGFSNQSAYRYRDINDVPGIRVPKWYELSIAISAGSTDDASVVQQMESEGPFICKQLQPYFVLDNPGTSTFPSGTRLSTTKYALTRQQLPTAGGSSFTGQQNIGTTTPEFSIRIQTRGSGRFWTGRAKITDASVYGYGLGPLYMPKPVWVDSADQISVTVTPEVPAGVGLVTQPTGTFKLVMHGFQILNPDFRLNQVFNYGP